MKKLISTLLCAATLCTSASFGAGAYDPPRNLLTGVPESWVNYEKELFGDHYITDGEAYAFAMNGFPGCGETDTIYSFPYTYYLECSNTDRDQVAAQLKEFLPGDNLYIISEWGDILGSWDQPIFPGAEGYTLELQGKPSGRDWHICDDMTVGMKLLHALTEYSAKYPEEKCTSGLVDLGIIGYNQYPGDTNDDGRLDARDIVAMKRFIVSDGANQRLNLHYSDINSDGKINMIDILLLKKYIVHIEKYPYFPEPDNFR